MLKLLRVAHWRSYATASQRKSRLGKTLSLDHVSLASQMARRRLRHSETDTKLQFLQRSRALALYRTILRDTRRISDPTTRAETRRFARDEFERHRDVTDIVWAATSTI